jgi:hypothetical protein
MAVEFTDLINSVPMDMNEPRMGRSETRAAAVPESSGVVPGVDTGETCSVGDEEDECFEDVMTLNLYVVLPLRVGVCISSVCVAS